jgi:hypothetical protein
MPPPDARDVASSSLVRQLAVKPRPLPAVVIRLPFEGRPQIAWSVTNDDDGRRLVQWIGDNEELADLVNAALDLAEAKG